MMSRDRLVQAFVDQELSAEERVQFLARLVRDEELRRCALALEQVLLTASTLPKPPVPDAFVASVMHRVERAQPPWRKALEVAFARPALRWNLASAAAGAFVALLALWGAVREPETAVNATHASTPSTVLVRLVVVQPGAHSVQVAGDFNGWNPASTPLEPTASGAWTVTLPLQPGRYEYMFVVDGKEWIADPFAAEESDDGFGARNAVIEVRPPGGTSL